MFLQSFIALAPKLRDFSNYLHILEMLEMVMVFLVDEKVIYLFKMHYLEQKGSKRLALLLSFLQQRVSDNEIDCGS